MNEIDQRQNEPQFLMFQYAARHYYNRAEILNYFVWLICIVNIMLVRLPFLSSQNVKVIILLFSIIAIGLQLLLQRIIIIAAAMRKYVDYSLFEFKMPTLFNKYTKEELVDLTIKVKHKKNQKAEEQYSSSGSDPQRGVKDWYVKVDPNFKRDEAILYCQKQNIWWEKKLSRIYLNTLLGLIVVAILIIITIFLNKTLLDFIYFLSSITALILKLIWEYIAIKKYRKISIESEALIQISNEMNDRYLLEMQKKIDERRNMLFHLPDFLHKVTTKQYHKTIHDRNTML